MLVSSGLEQTYHVHYFFVHFATFHAVDQASYTSVFYVTVSYYIKREMPQNDKTINKTSWPTKTNSYYLHYEGYIYIYLYLISYNLIKETRDTPLLSCHSC